MKLKEVAFNILGKDVAWYGIIITVGIILSFWYVHWRATKFEGLKSDDVFDYAIFGVIIAIIGARAYYVLTTLDVYEYNSFYDVIAIWNGGLAIYGALIAGSITMIVVSIVKKINPLKILDPLGPGVMIGQAIGRWGNFVNAEAFGRETTLPWRMGIQNIYHIDTIYVHPTFLYESLWNILGFIIINASYKHKRFNGQPLFMYVSWYGFGRMLIESLRTDSLYVGPFRISQVIGLVTFIVGIICLIVLSFISDKKYKAQLAAETEKENNSTLFEKEDENTDEGTSKEEKAEASEEKSEDNTEDNKQGNEEQEKNNDGKDN